MNDDDDDDDDFEDSDDFEDDEDDFEDDDDDDGWNASPGLEVRRIRRLHASDEDPHENSDDEADNEGGPWVVTIEAESFHDAVRGLEDDTTSFEDVVEHLVIATTHQYAPARHSRRDLLLRHPAHFRRFVTLLGHPNRVIRAVTFVSVNFVANTEVPHRRRGGEEDDEGEVGDDEGEVRDDDSSTSRNDNVTEVTIREEDLEELFGSTLPRHRTLQKIEFENCHIPGAYFERFTSSLPSSIDDDDGTPLTQLALERSIDGEAHLPYISDLLRRNARLPHLALSVGFHGLEPDEFLAVCGGLDGNTNLRTLTIRLADVELDTLDLALAPNSPLRQLHVEAGLSDPGATTALANLLTTNGNLVELTLAEHVGRVSDERRLDAVAAAMETANCTLQKFAHGTHDALQHHHLLVSSRIGKCLRRNRWIHHVLQAWPNYRVPSKALWPTVLHKADGCPTLLYRFLRRGNLPAVCDVVVVVGGGGGSSEQAAPGKAAARHKQEEGAGRIEEECGTRRLPRKSAAQSQECRVDVDFTRSLTNILYRLSSTYL
jgi:hypothetical protein